MLMKGYHICIYNSVRALLEEFINPEYNYSSDGTMIHSQFSGMDTIFYYAHLLSSSITWIYKNP